MSKRLCVCLPTWNGARFIARTLRSVLAQQGIDLTVMVGDDGSDDNTIEVAESFRDPRLRVHGFSEHLGLVGNWNRLVQMADGHYLALLCQDDEVVPNWGACLVGLLDAHPEANLAFGHRNFVFGDGGSRSLVGQFFEHTYPEILAGFYKRIGEVVTPEIMLEEAHRYCFEINLIGEPSFVIVRRNSPAIAAGFDPFMAQMVDWEFYTRFFVDRPILHSPKVLGTYHIHAKAASIANASLAIHYRDYDHLLGTILQRFARVLGENHRTELEQRQGEVRDLIRVYAQQAQSTEICRNPDKR